MVLFWLGWLGMSYRNDLWEIAATRNGVVTVKEAEDAGVPAIEVRKLASRGALVGHGHGVYTHRWVPATALTEPTLAVALAGEGALLHRESVLALFDLGQFNPPRVRVGTRRRVRRALPVWLELETRNDLSDDDVTDFDGIPGTTVSRALGDMHQRMPVDRYQALLDEALQRDLATEEEISRWKAVSASLL